METMQQTLFPPSSQTLDFSAFENQDYESLFPKFSFDELDGFDNLEDSLTKDTSTPKELTRFEENTVTNIGLLNKQIQKAHKEKKSKVKHLFDEASIHCANMGEKRESKKPVHEYEKTRKEEDQRRKTKRVVKKNMKMKETVAHSVVILAQSSAFNRVLRATVCYEWRDWNIFFNQELASLKPEEFVIFIKMVMDQHPECVSFEKGYAELKVVAPSHLKVVSENPNEKLSRFGNENVMYKILSGYIEHIKKQRATLINQVPWKN